MEKPTAYEKSLSILVLRTLGCSQDTTGSILGCRKQTVVEAEQWVQTCPLHEAISVLDDQAIRRLVGREFPAFEQISPELLLKAGQVTGDDILRHYRQDYLRVRGKYYEEEQKFSGLSQRWREQLAFLSVAQLLRKYRFESRGTDMKCEVTESEDVRQAYLHELGRHWETIPRPLKAMLPVQSECLFGQLKKLHPSAEVWRAQDSWAEAYGVYLDAFSSWVVEVEYDAELLMGAAADESASKGLDGKVTSARCLVEELKRKKPVVWLFLCLLALTVACDLFLLGIGERPADVTWVPVVEETKKLRDDVVLTSIEELSKDFRLTGENRVYAIVKSLWDKDERVKEKTIALVEALAKLQTAQNNLHDKIKALEHSLSS